MIYAIGNKGREALERRGYHIELEDSAMIESPSYEDAAALCKKILKSFSDGEIGEIYLAYTHFKICHQSFLWSIGRSCSQ